MGEGQKQTALTNHVGKVREPPFISLVFLPLPVTRWESDTGELKLSNLREET